MKKPYCSLSREELTALQKELEQEYKKVQEKGLQLDMSRGKPSRTQLDLTMGMLDVVNSKSDLDAESGMDCRNYGGLDGIPEAKQLMASIMNTHMDNVIIGGNSSLTLMYQLISHGMTDGICGNKPWYEIKNRKFLWLLRL